MGKARSFARRNLNTAFRAAGSLYKHRATVGKLMSGLRRNKPSLRGSTKKRTTSMDVQRVQRVRPAAAGSTFSHYRKTFKPQSGLYYILKQAIPRNYTYTEGSTLKVLQNKQNYHDTRIFADIDVSGLYAMVTPNLDGNAAANAADVRLYVDDGVNEYLLTNGANTNIFVDIYELTARRDQSVGSTKSGSANAIDISRPSGTIDQGLYESNSSLTMNNLGFNPFDSRKFTTMWHCDKWITIELEPGKTHKHLSRTVVRRFIEKDRTSEAQNFRDLTRSVMIRARGQPVCDATTDTNVALSEAELQIVMIRKVNMRITSNPTSWNTTSQNLSTVTSSFINDESGAKTSYIHS